MVIGRWADDTALLRLDDGSTLEVPVPEALREEVDVGTRATVGPGGAGDVDWGRTPEGRSSRGRFWPRSRR